VVFAQSFVVTQGSDRAEPFMRLTHGQTTGGTIAVDAFFILSGFLITASYERSNSLLFFLKKRIVRIYPGFLVVSVVAAVCFVPLGGGRLEGSRPAGRDWPSGHQHYAIERRQVIGGVRQ
jgi:peptidoglycan/LPS O-acetylase OafA/YrhL